jgi:hypothetical protein
MLRRELCLRGEVLSGAMRQFDNLVLPRMQPVAVAKTPQCRSHYSQQRLISPLISLMTLIGGKQEQFAANPANVRE